MNKSIGISGWGSISPLGRHREEIVEAYRQPQSLLQFREQEQAWGGAIGEEANNRLHYIQRSNKAYRKLDRSVLLALEVAEQLTGALPAQENIGLNLSSSRGATASLEQALQQAEALSPFTSPNTTLGNLSFWVARHLDLKGITFSHSITCTSAMHSLFNGIAWLQSGLSQAFIAGGTEAPLTPFTIAQMQALRIYATTTADAYPCRAMDLHKVTNSMVLGEGAALFVLESTPRQPLAWIRGIGYGREPIRHAADLSIEGEAIEQAMRMALADEDPQQIDVVITHSPGTLKGDQAERKAIERVFGKKIPQLTNNKWKIGHTLGASAALSLEMALLMLQYNEFFPVPYLESSPEPTQRPIAKILINAMGFGGQASSLLVSGTLDD